MAKSTRCLPRAASLTERYWRHRYYQAHAKMVRFLDEHGTHIECQFCGCALWITPFDPPADAVNWPADVPVILDDELEIHQCPGMDQP